MTMGLVVLAVAVVLAACVPRPCHGMTDSQDSEWLVHLHGSLGHARLLSRKLLSHA
jgi:hypothetical protein